jgi:hypothetical protein
VDATDLIIKVRSEGNGNPSSNELVNVKINYQDEDKQDSVAEQQRKYGKLSSNTAKETNDIGNYKVTYTAGYLPRTVEIEADVVRNSSVVAYHTVTLLITIFDQIPPNIVIRNPKGEIVGGVLKIEAEIDDASKVKSATLSYRIGGITEWKGIQHWYENVADMRNKKNPTLSWTIPSDDVTVRGLAYYIEAEDMSDNYATYGTEETPNSVEITGEITAEKITRSPGGEVYYTIPPLADAGPNPSENGTFKQYDPAENVWYMVSLPVNVEDPYLDKVFGADWYAYARDTVESTWKSKADGPQFLPVGRGALVAPVASDLIFKVTGTSRDITKKAVIPLDVGWNLIGNPFSFGRFWDDTTISVRRDGKVEDITEASNLGWVYHTIWYANPSGPEDDIGGEYYDAVSSDPRVPNQAWEKDGDSLTQFPAAIGPFGGFFILAFNKSELLISPTTYGPDDLVPPPPLAPVASSETALVLDVKPPEIPNSLSGFDKNVDVTAVYQNYPNPFNPETWIPYQLSKEADVVIHIYTMAGQLVRTLNLGRKSTGFYLTKENAAYWNGKNDAGEKIASGLYFYQLQAGDFKSPVVKMVILK